MKCVIATYIDAIYDIYLSNPIFVNLLESSLHDNSNKWSNIEFGKEIGILENKTLVKPL